MKLSSCWILLLILPIQLLAQSPGDQKFVQEVVTIHSSQDGLPQGKISQVTLTNGQPIARGAGSTVQLSNRKWIVANNEKPLIHNNLPAIPGNKILTSVSYQGGFAIGCDEGLFFYKNGKKPERILPKNDQYSWSLRDVSALVTDSKGRLWFGSEEGVGYLDKGKWKLFTGKEGLPCSHFTCAAAGKDGIVWFGTQKGAIEVENDQFKYRFSRRWLPDDQVNAIVVNPDNGTAWIATDQGISEITRVSMSFEEKARHFTKQVEERHNRMGFIAQSI